MRRKYFVQINGGKKRSHIVVTIDDNGLLKQKTRKEDLGCFHQKDMINV